MLHESGQRGKARPAGRIIVGELDLFEQEELLAQAQKGRACTLLADQERFCAVQDDIFNFLIDVSTEVRARIKLKEDAKTVQDGGLWYEESLPTETILSGIVLAIPTKQLGIASSRVFDVLRGLTDTTLQFGGNATVGRGLCRVLFDKATTGKEA